MGRKNLHTIIDLDVYKKIQVLAAIDEKNVGTIIEEALLLYIDNNQDKLNDLKSIL